MRLTLGVTAQTIAADRRIRDLNTKLALSDPLPAQDDRSR